MDNMILLERALAIFYLVCGISLILNPQRWLDFVQKHTDQDTTTWGIISTLTGSFLVAFHNIWESSPVVITTIIAWCALIKGIILLSYPGPLMKFCKKTNSNKCLLRWKGFFSIILAGLIGYYTF
ncbi:MAG: hypothetical protein OXB84_09300 [Halobacteriovoraceae bacterium]|nr:hypothetical protein [Halobacteriovoraceae bacterium]